jgi:signal transduction histidine kinase/HAMP domain-containing protein
VRAAPVASKGEEAVRIGPLESRRFLGMRWWLGVAFSAVAGLTAVAVVALFSARTAGALRAYAEEFAVGNAVAASEALARLDTDDLRVIRQETARLAAGRGIALFVFDRDGKRIATAEGPEARWAGVPDGDAALRRALEGHRYIHVAGDDSSFVIGVGIHQGLGAALVVYSTRPEFQEQLTIIRSEFLRAAIAAFVVGAAFGFLIAGLIARRLAGIARVARTIREGNFGTPIHDPFPDEVGSLATSIEAMRLRLRGSFETLESERRRLKSLLEGLNEGVLLIDRELAVEYANGQARELLGFGSTVASLASTAGPLASAVRDIARELFARASETRQRVADEEHSFIVTGIPPARDRETAIIAIHDESQRERHDRAQRQFATNAAHQLRTPLASIVTAVEMLQTGAKDEVGARDRFLEIIEREAQRLSRLTQSLLVLARAKAREESPRLTTVPLRPMLERLVEGTTAPDVLRLTVDCPPELALRTNEGLLEQALASLVENALRHTSSGSIRLRASRSGDQATIEVIDHGKGMDGLDRQQVFERFYRGDNTDEKSSFGLGLAIARDAVRSLGGDIELQSERNVGTTVRLIFSGVGV